MRTRRSIAWPLGAATALAWILFNVFQHLSTYWFIVALIPLPALGILLAYLTALAWYGEASPSATSRS